MSEEQLSALFARLTEDAELLENLKSAADLDAAVAITKGAGFDVSKDDWLKYQTNQMHELNDEELEAITGGAITITIPIGMITAWGFMIANADQGMP